MKKHAQVFASVPSLLFFMSLLTPLHAATYKIHWFLAHKNLDYFEEAAQNFKKTVETVSKGDISVDIVVLPQDGASQNSVAQDPGIAARVANGEAEMGHSFVDVLGGLDPRLHAFEAPYLFRGYRHMEGVIEGPVGSELLDGLRPKGIVGLSFTYSGGASGVATKDREVRLPKDLKGLRIGVYGDEVNEAWLNELGAKAVPIGHDLDRIVPMARDNALDGVVITWRNFERTEIDTDFKYVNLMSSTYLVSMTYINEKFLAGLPQEYQSLIVNASRETGRIERAKTIELNETARRTMQSKGVRPVHLTEVNKRRFVEALRPAYERSIDRVIGKDMLRKIRNAPDADAHPALIHDLAKL